MPSYFHWIPDDFPYVSTIPTAEQQTRCIGWLNRDQPYQTGVVDPHTISRLKTFEAYPIYHYRTATQNYCPLCCGEPKNQLNQLDSAAKHLGLAELRIIGTDGSIYAVPNNLSHLIQVHHYLPPNVFLTTLTNGLDPNSGEYHKSLQAILTAREQAVADFYPQAQKLTYEIQQAIKLLSQTTPLVSIILEQISQQYQRYGAFVLANLLRPPYDPLIISIFYNWQAGKLTSPALQQWLNRLDLITAKLAF